MKNSGKKLSDFRGYVGFLSNCYRMAEPPEVVMELVGWDGIDPLPELPLFHATAEDSFGGSIYIFGEPAVLCLEVWRAYSRYHGDDEETPVQEALVLAKFWSFLVRSMETTGNQWSCLSPVKCNCSNCKQSMPGGSASQSPGRVCSGHGQLVTRRFPSRGEVLGGNRWASCAWSEQLLPAG